MEDCNAAGAAYVYLAIAIFRIIFCNAVFVRECFFFVCANFSFFGFFSSNVADVSGSGHNIYFSLIVNHVIFLIFIHFVLFIFVVFSLSLSRSLFPWGSVFFP